jgi:hypothetical protein
VFIERVVAARPCPATIFLYRTEQALKGEGDLSLLWLESDPHTGYSSLLQSKERNWLRPVTH